MNSKTDQCPLCGGNETTVRFWREIYDDQGKLVEIHEEYPVDKGHQKV